MIKWLHEVAWSCMKLHGIGCKSGLRQFRIFAVTFVIPCSRSCVLEDIMRILSCDAFPLSNPCVGYEATPWVDRGLIAAGIPKSCSSWPCWAEAWWQHWAQDPNPVVLHWHRPFQRHLCFLHRTGTLGMEMMEMMEMDLPSGYVKNSYWKWPIEIVDLPIKNGGSFHSYVAVYQAG